MRKQLPFTRFYAVDLADVLAEQGRRQDWLAQQIGVSKPMMSYIISGRRTVSEPVARQISALLGVPFGMHFELSSERQTLSVGVA